jgi:hypothetical protein
MAPLVASSTAFHFARDASGGETAGRGPVECTNCLYRKEVSEKVDEPNETVGGFNIRQIVRHSAREGHGQG